MKRLLLAFAISFAIIIGFEKLMPQPVRHPVASSTRSTPPGAVPHAGNPLTPPGSEPAAIPPPGPEHRLPIDATRVHGSIDLIGARFDDLLLADYHETIKPGSPLVRVLEPQDQKQPNLVQLGWSAVGDAKVPDGSTLWTADQPKLTPDTPVTLSWDNGAGLVFQLLVSIDRNYMFTVHQRVLNHGAQPVSLFAWSRVSRGYTPVVTGGYLVHEGPIAITDGRMEEMSYSSLRSKSAENGGTAWSATQGPADASAPGGAQGSAQGSAPGSAQGSGWAGITDKYWLTAVIPDNAQPVTASYRYIANDGAGTYQADFITQQPIPLAAGGTLDTRTYVFAGAKEVHLLDRYQSDLHITDFWKAVDFGWFAFLTRPIFFVLDWLNTALGNFGVALLVFTLIVKTLFFPLAVKQFRSMAKMKLLAPKMQAIRERHKGDPMATNQEMMALYKTEGANPAAGCLPMLVQVPVFWCLYKDLLVTIEMRQAPFFGWIHDLSEPDPTNIFNLFGLLPFDPSTISPFLHLGVWPIILGGTMLLMQRMNPPPADPAQARLFQIMPLIFMFVLARQPAGLVIYYCGNNLLTVTQQWLIQRRTRLGNTRRLDAVRS